MTDTTDKNAQFDAIIVGAGFAGMYMLYRLRNMGMRVRVYEMGDNVGGTWYWNRYPGARCDAESLAYSFSFSPEMEQEWSWSERYSTQPEILKYAEHVAERFDLRRDIRFERKVCAAHFDESTNEWTVETEQGDRARARFCIMATGCLSVPLIPDIAGLDDFAGERHQASLWPHEGVDFTGKTVGIIGTGSSAIQAIPVIAEQAKHLYVFQRTPNFSVPAANVPLDPEFVGKFKKHYREHRENHKKGLGQGFGELKIEPYTPEPRYMSIGDLALDDVRDALEEYWHIGGARFVGVIGDVLMSPRANEVVADFVRDKIRQTVKDPQTAENLCPTSHPIGTKRICVDTNYYETFNRDSVTLINLRETPIEKITPSGLLTSTQHYDFDTLVLATGFDAMTGALLNMDIRGVDGLKLGDKWEAGPRNYLGLNMTGFPNLFTITGPGSPSVLSNMIVSIEQHVDWLVDLFEHMKENDKTQVEAEQTAEDKWVEHVNEVANMTLFPKGGSWYLGANVPGKPRIFMPYAAGVGAYREVCDKVTADGYEGFVFR
ncbi:MAG: NAD(P)/FAD-dependent oxidoreductase [Pseudomonadota bacterium]